MGELNSVAKQIHKMCPEAVEITLEDGTKATFQISRTEFFQQEFQAEGTRVDDDAEYRFVSSKDNESILVGRKGQDESEWTMLGAIRNVRKPIR